MDITTHWRGSSSSGRWLVHATAGIRHSCAKRQQPVPPPITRADRVHPELHPSHLPLSTCLFGGAAAQDGQQCGLRGTAVLEGAGLSSGQAFQQRRQQPQKQAGGTNNRCQSTRYSRVPAAGGRWARTLPPPEGPISASISPGSHEPEMSNSTCRERREILQRSSTQTASQYVLQLDEQVGAAAAGKCQTARHDCPCSCDRAQLTAAIAQAVRRALRLLAAAAGQPALHPWRFIRFAHAQSMHARSGHTGAHKPGRGRQRGGSWGGSWWVATQQQQHAPAASPPWTGWHPSWAPAPQAELPPPWRRWAGCP